MRPAILLGMATIAFCGLGMMGWELAGRLRSAGHDLRVWNRSHQKATAWVAQGGTACDSPEHAASNTSEAHIMVSDDAAVESIIFGSHGLLDGLRSEGLIVDHTTVSVSGAKERERRIKSRGFHFLQSPVFGSPPHIREGKGLLLVGGDPKTYEAAQSRLRDLLPDHFRAGDQAADAATFKLMGNAFLMCVVEALSEFFAIGKANGIEPSRALMLLDVFNPCGTIARRGPRMATGDYAPMFSLSMAQKDTGLMLDAAGDASRLPALRAILDKMKRLGSEGYANLDLAALGIETIPAKA